MQIDAANRLEDLHRFDGDFLADAITCDHGDSMCHEQILAAEMS